MSRERRGLTLLETLLASAILAMLAGACIPMLSAAARSLTSQDAKDRNRAQTLRFGLADLADAFMRDSRKFGCQDLRKEIQQGVLSVHWPDDAAELTRYAGAIVVRALPPANEEANHLWLVFTCGGQSMVRYLALPKEAPPK